MNRAGPGSSQDSVMQNQVRRLLKDEYGVNGNLARLPGENLNYLVRSIGKNYVLKIASQERSNTVIDMEHKATEYAVDSGIGIQVPRTVMTRKDTIVSELSVSPGVTMRARLLGFVAGTPWCELNYHDDRLLAHLGETLAGIDLKLSNFEHPAMYRTHRWDLTALTQHRDKINLVEDSSRRIILERMFHCCVAELKLRLASLPKSYIHNDANDENILIADNQVVGLLDFGDSLYNPVVCGLAIALAYVMLNRDEPLAAAARVVAAYHRVRALTEDEQWSLLPMVCGRLATTVAVAAERRTIDPGHPNWFVTEKSAWKLLERLYELDPTSVGTRPGFWANIP